jgi:hypothetical protein
MMTLLTTRVFYRREHRSMADANAILKFWFGQGEPISADHSGNGSQPMPASIGFASIDSPGIMPLRVSLISGSARRATRSHS